MKKKMVLFFIVGLLGISSFNLAIGGSSSSFDKNIIDDSDNLMKSSLLLQDEISINSVTGGFARISVELENNGDNVVENVEWSIYVEGGFFNLVNVLSEGSFSSFAPGDKIVVQSKPIIGLGSLEITVIVNSVTKNYKGDVFLIFNSVNQGLTIDFETIATGITSPIGLAHAGDSSNRLFVIDQTGIIYVIDDEVLLNEPFLDISDKVVELDITYDERGLLGLAFHPDYENNGRFFVYYSAPKQGQNINHETILSEYTVSDENANIADPDSEKIIFRIDQPEANHNGGSLIFGPDGYLYLGLGDGGGAGDVHGDIGNGQDINTALGSIIRIDIDSGDPYSVPSDNPFVGEEGIDEIYAYGLRNPWRFSFDRDTGELFCADVGQDEWEEVNIIEKGLNYGWRILEATHPYDLELADDLGIDIETLAGPINEYSHSLGRSVTGGYIYRGSEFPSIAGRYIFGDWSSSFFLPRGKIFYLEESEPGSWVRYEFQPIDTFNRFVVSFGEDELGELYVLTKSNLGPTGSSGDVRKMIFE